MIKDKLLRIRPPKVMRGMPGDAHAELIVQLTRLSEQVSKVIKACYPNARSCAAVKADLPVTKDNPCCVKCGSVEVYKMTDAKTGERNKRFLWRCRDCKEQYTVRIGTVYEESRIELRHWCYTFWRAATSKKGVSALEIKRHCQISYKSALFLMNRIRFAMAPDLPTAPKLSGIIEADETYVGGKPRPGDGKVHKKGRGTSKTPVFAVVERDGAIRRRVVANVT